MAEATETAPNPTNAVPSTEAAAAVLLGAEAVNTQTTQQQPEPTTTDTSAEPKPPETPKPGEGAPEKYEFKAPEGKAFDASILTAFETAARESNLTQDAAQKLLDSMAPKIAERQAEQITAIHNGWLDASKSDKEFGGDKLEANLGIAKKALDTFGSPELKQLLVSTGLGNHPEVIRVFFKAGKAISEDSFVAGSAPGKSQVDRLAVLYDKTP